MTVNFDPENMPQHVAIIMDGNGRWAKQQGKLRVFGHQNGVKAVRSAVSFAAKHGIKVLTLYAFSSENWNRPETEVSALMTLFMTALNSEVKKLHKNNIKLKVIGDKSRFSEGLQKRIQESEDLTAQNTGLILNVAANYGGYWDITQAAQKMAQKVKMGELAVEEITPEIFEKALVTEEQPQVDLLIRTSGEQRISNFLLWQIAYAELFFTPVLWPDFDDQIFSEAIVAYQQRNRRFGGC
nr:polyprenyl diphosphate synthase [uncultured Haemophilus sp.]